MERAVEILSHIIRIPTVNPPGREYGTFVDYAEKLLRNVGMDVEVVEVPRHEVARVCDECADYPRYIVVARIGEPRLHFNGHYDVVPPGQGWTVTDPFTPRIAGNRLYGRGAQDMKGGVAAILAAAEEALRQGASDFEISLVPDEEIGGETGAGYLVRNVGVRAPWAIIAEGSGYDNIWIGHKGLVWFMVEVYGKQVHGSVPWLGLNAFEGAVKLASRIIGELKPRIESRISKYDYDDPNGKRATINIGGEVRGSVKTNVVPGFFAFSIDRRVLPDEDLDAARREIEDFVAEASKGLGDYKVELRVTNVADAALIDPTHPLVERLAGAVREATGSEPRRTVCIGGLDARFFVKAGIPTATYGPGPMYTAHTPDEYVYIDQVVAVSKVFRNLMLGR